MCWVTLNIEFFPDLLNDCQVCAKNNKGGGLVGIEIGVAAGEHALSLLNNLNMERLYLFDPYEDYEHYLEGKLHYGIDPLAI